jgi:phosphatidylglycerol:prolipoprotein diacylglycerol transferase
MIDPILYTIKIGDFLLPIRWYGILVMLGVLAATWVTDREVRRRGRNPEFIYDALLWVLPAGIIGARLWYVLNDIAGGNPRFLEQPWRIINLPEGGLHIYGAILLGGLTAYLFARRKGIDIWLLLDSAAPAMLIGQAVARPANFINQELYGPPTGLPWGIPISGEHRLPPWNDLLQFPVETTRFHPTFAYEMIWNLLSAALLLWIGRRFEKQLKPGMLFAGWLVLAGVGRALIESFRPDQPLIPGTGVSYSRLVSALMALGGLVWVLASSGKIKLPGKAGSR